MAGNVELVEALAFARRRLLAAFVAGTPGHGEGPRPGRAVVAGVVLAGLVVAGAAIAAVVAPRADIAWDGPDLVVDGDTGALYVIADELPGTGGPGLRAVANATSARLLAGGGAPQHVPGAVIAASPQGPPVGLPGAPVSVPAPDALLPTGWTACTGPGGRVQLAITPEAAAAPVVPDTGIVVRHGTEQWLVATTRSHDGRAVTRRHRVAAGSEVGAGEAVAVPRRWLALVPAGGPAPDVAVPAPPADARVCVVLDRVGEEGAAVRLAVSPRGYAAAPDDAPPGTTTVRVAPGHGAVVRAAAGTAYLVAERGRRHPVTDDALARLGLGDVDPVPLPGAWLDLLDEGVALSAGDARCPPGRTADPCD